MSMAPQTSPETADTELRAAGYEPLKIYPGRVTDPWPARCTTCGEEVDLLLTQVRVGRRCSHRNPSSQAAAAEVGGAGYQPQEPYPGMARTRWRLKCRACGRGYSRSLNAVRLGAVCSCRGRAVEAEKELRAAGYEPLEPFPGTARAPWPSRCSTCRQERRPSLSTIRSGKRCLHLLPESE